MAVHTHLEDLSNEIFAEIFDYLDAFDIFTGFTSLNQRITSILQSIPLRILISYDYCRRQIDFLSSHLTIHAHQVISLKIDDTIHDYSSVISLLFHRHHFINLESCTFVSINPSTKLDNVIRQIKSLNRLVSFTIRQSCNKIINVNDISDITRMILMHKSSSLHSIVLNYPHDYLNVSNYTPISSNLLSLNLIISSSSSTVSVYSILSILRLCHTVRYLGIIIGQNNLVDSNSIQVPSINNNDLPILSQMISFDLAIFAICNIHSIACVLRCMPNLIRFYLTIGIPTANWPFPGELLDGYVWLQLLERHLPCLFKFEFHISILKRYPKLDLDIIVNSFECLVRKYSNWHMIIDRWKHQIREEYVMLRTSNYHKRKSKICVNIPFIHCRSFETRSTTTTNDHHLFYSNLTVLRIWMIKRSPTITWSAPLFQQIKYLILQIPRRHPSLWNNLLNVVNSHQIHEDHDIQQSVTEFSYFVHLPNVIRIEFQSKFDITQWQYIQFILQACPNVFKLIISTRLLLLSKLMDNPSLMPLFKQIKMIESRTGKVYFSSSLALKFVQRFPSLTYIELQVFSFDHCVSLIEIFLTHLEYLSYLKIYYNQDTLFEDPFSRDYIIGKRRQTFPNNMIHEQAVTVKNNGEVVEIWLS